MRSRKKKVSFGVSKGPQLRGYHKKSRPSPRTPSTSSAKWHKREKRSYFSKVRGSRHGNRCPAITKCDLETPNPVLTSPEYRQSVDTGGARARHRFGSDWRLVFWTSPLLLCRANFGALDSSDHGNGPHQPIACCIPLCLVSLLVAFFF